MIKHEEGTYEYIKADVTSGGIVLRYKGSTLKVPGSDFINDPSAKERTDDEVRDAAARHLGVTEDRDEIEVMFNTL